MFKRLALCSTLMLLPMLTGIAEALAEEDTVQISEIIAAARSDGFAWGWLSDVCDLIGPRLAGSAQLDRAAEYSVETFRAAGFDRVWTEPTTVPRWVRGDEWARLT